MSRADAGLAVALFGLTAVRAIDAMFARRLLGRPERPPHRYVGAGGTGEAGGCGDDGGCGDGGE
ncbi:hypothetical protein [Asanoa sp. NPDC050611]|uniref:hypothetical protein n=1 Tax=Asanoa sp. NPDC050611 TaxID=3157098 RepID=UPI0033CFD25A